MMMRMNQNQTSREEAEHKFINPIRIDSEQQNIEQPFEVSIHHKIKPSSTELLKRQSERSLKETSKKPQKKKFYKANTDDD